MNKLLKNESRLSSNLSSQAEADSRAAVRTYPLIELLVLSGLAIGVLSVYWPSLNGPYAFDDQENLKAIANHSVGFPPPLSWHRPETRPLVLFSFACEEKLFGSAPAVHRFGNIVIHILGMWVLFDLVKRLRSAVEWDGIVSPSVFALCVAGIWGLHPLQTESVAYIVQRGESLMGLFYFGFLNAIARYHSSGKLTWGVVAITCFVLGLWSKTVIVTALAVAPLMDRAFFCSSWRAVLKKTSWLYLPPIALGMFAAVLLLPGILKGEANVGFGGFAPPMHLHLAAQAEMVWRYLALSFLPYDLCIDYGLHPPSTVQSQSVWIFLTLCLIAVGVFLYLTKSPVAGFCILAPLIVLSITSSVIPTADLLVEHRMYVSLAAVAAAAVLCLENAVIRLRTTDRSQAFGLIVTVFTLLLGGMTYIRAADYASGVLLWSKAVLVSPDNDRAIQNLMYTVGKNSEAEIVIPIVVRAIGDCQRRGLNPRVPLQRLGELLVRGGSYADAVPALERAIELDEQSKGSGYRDLNRDRDRAAMHVNLALSLAALSDLERAYENMLSAIACFDVDASVRAMAGDFAKQLKKPEEARLHFQRALELRPDWREVQADLKGLEVPVKIELDPAR